MHNRDLLALKLKRSGKRFNIALALPKLRSYSMAKSQRNGFWSVGNLQNFN